jgi:hypothetical protein
VTSDGIGASASFDPVYRVWDVVTGEFMFEVEAEGVEQVGTVAFTHDGRHMVYEDAGGVVRATPVDTYEAVERAQAAVTRNFTDDECRRYLHIESCGAD